MPTKGGALGRLINAGWIRPQAGWGMAAHRHADLHELILVRRGVLETRMAGETRRAGPGEALFYPCGATHAEQAFGTEALETFFVGWTPDPEGADANLPGKSRDVEGRMECLMRWLHSLAPPGRRSGAVNRLGNALLFALLSEYARGAGRSTSEPIRRALALIAAHLNEPLPLSRLARVAGLSRFHFLRRFKAEKGWSPGAYVRRRRIESARALLLATPLPLKTIAAQTGFADACHLSKAFRAVEGCAPGSLRRPAGVR